MVHKFEKYTYRVTWSEEDEEFVGLCSEFPSLSWLAGTSEETLKGIHSAVKQCLEDSLKTEKKHPFLYPCGIIVVSLWFVFLQKCAGI